MGKRIISCFKDSQKVEEAVKELKNQGFDELDIAIFTKEGDGEISDDGKLLTNSDPQDEYTFTDINTGNTNYNNDGIVSVLVNYGLPVDACRYFAGRMNVGRKLLVLQVDKDEEAENAAQVLRSHGAQEVQSYTDYNAGLA